MDLDRGLEIIAQIYGNVYWNKNCKQKTKLIVNRQPDPQSLAWVDYENYMMHDFITTFLNFMTIGEHSKHISESCDIIAIVIC